MNGACCRGHDDAFGERVARGDLRRFRRRGPLGTTRTLLRALRAQGLENARLLDVGGGVGAIPLSLLGHGVCEADAVDASPAYLDAAAGEARRRGLEGRMHAHLGDAVEVAPTLPAPDVVTLDRALCCYGAPIALIDATAARARRLYGVVYPRDTAPTRWGVGLGNGLMRLRGKPMRVFVHDPKVLRARIEGHGFARVFAETGWIWHVEVYRRAG